MIFATAGMYLADLIEQQKPATEIERLELEILSPIVIVDHQSKE